MKRYRSFNGYLREMFGFRVHKITIDAGFSCPNRDGTIDSRGCVYCDALGSGSGAFANGKSIKEQLSQGISYARKRYKARKFIAYFQAFTNTYAPVEALEKAYHEGLDHPDVVGISVGTRPDCVSDEVVDLIAGLATDKLIWVELGLQSANVETLRRINRGHGVSDFIDASLRLMSRRIHVCAHVIIGLPRETDEDFRETADLISALGIDGVKIHSLYVPRSSQLAEEYRNGQVRLMSREEYVHHACDFIERIPPEMVIQRLTGETSRDDLLAPEWVLDKATTIRMIDEELEKRNTRQGQRCRFVRRN